MPLPLPKSRKYNNRGYVEILYEDLQLRFLGRFLAFRSLDTLGYILKAAKLDLMRYGDACSVGECMVA